MVAAKKDTKDSSAEVEALKAELEKTRKALAEALKAELEETRKALAESLEQIEKLKEKETGKPAAQPKEKETGKPAAQPKEKETGKPAAQLKEKETGKPAAQPKEKTIKDGHEYVDLGLSVKWATCNVGASKPEDYGNYYAWGETMTKSSYTEDNSKIYGKFMGDINGNSSYDAARANWGGNWRMPTETEMQELIDKCKWEWVTVNGVKGYKVTSKTNGNSIFLPAAGFRGGSSLYNAGSDGYYWSSAPYVSDSNYAYDLGFYSVNRNLGINCRDNGRCIRPVSELEQIEKLKEKETGKPAAQPKEKTIKDVHEYVDLGLSVKWATCNVGASKPEDYGNYYAWGETSTKSSYKEYNSKTYGKNMGDINGNSSYDAARANWGGKWRMPTEAEMQELIDKCKWEWVTVNGVKGYKVTSKTNGNSIFLPATGERYCSSLFHAGSRGRYWSSTGKGCSYYAYFLDFYSDGHYMSSFYRYYGHPVRPVLE